jgi:hypothetical protein
MNSNNYFLRRLINTVLAAAVVLQPVEGCNSGVLLSSDVDVVRVE